MQIISSKIQETNKTNKRCINNSDVNLQISQIFLAIGKSSFTNLQILSFKWYKMLSFSNLNILLGVVKTRAKVVHKNVTYVLKNLQSKILKKTLYSILSTLISLWTELYS